MIRAFISIELSSGSVIKYVRDSVVTGKDSVYYEYTGVSGYQELGLSSTTAEGDTGLAQTTDYVVDLSVDGAAATTLTINLSVTPTFQALVDSLNEATTGATWAIIDGDIRCTSNKKDAGSSVSIVAKAGDSITTFNLLTTITGFTALDVAVAGEFYGDQIGAGKIKGDFDSIFTSLTGTQPMLAFPESAGDTPYLIRHNSGTPSNSGANVITTATRANVTNIQVVEYEAPPEFRVG